VAQGGKGFGDAAEKTAAMGTDAKPGQFPRTVTHALGKTELKGLRSAAAEEPAGRRPRGGVSPEKIDEADADWIFTGVYGDPKVTKRDTARANPLWKNLKAVKAGRPRTYRTRPGTWAWASPPRTRSSMICARI